MTFENRAEYLRQRIPFNARGDYPYWLETWEAEQFANINDGIAEILALLTRNTGGEAA